MLSKIKEQEDKMYMCFDVMFSTICVCFVFDDYQDYYSAYKSVYERESRYKVKIVLRTFMIVVRTFNRNSTMYFSLFPMILIKF